MCSRIGIVDLQTPVRLAGQPAGWLRCHEGYNPTAVVFRQARLSASATAVTEPVNALGVESFDPLPYGLRMTLELNGNGRCTPAIPTQGYHLGAHDPVAWRMAAGSEFSNRALFRIITRRAGLKQLRHILNYTSTRHRS